MPWGGGRSAHRVCSLACILFCPPMLRCAWQPTLRVVSTSLPTSIVHLLAQWGQHRRTACPLNVRSASSCKCRSLFPTSCVVQRLARRRWSYIPPPGHRPAALSFRLFAARAGGDAAAGGAAGTAVVALKLGGRLSATSYRLCCLMLPLRLLPLLLLLCDCPALLPYDGSCSIATR